jgi:hypothetical protein
MEHPLLLMQALLARAPANHLGASMSRRGLARHNARRDANEPLIVSAFEARGWTVVKLSGKGLPDLLCMKNTQILGPQYILVDVKMPKGEFKPAQVETWKRWGVRGLPVYVATTEDDVLAIIQGTAQPWGELDAAPKREKREPVPIRTRLGPHVSRPAPNYVSPIPHGSPTNPLGPKAFEPSNVDEHRALLAAMDAQETFAPPPCTLSVPCGHCMNCIGTLP